MPYVLFCLVSVIWGSSFMLMKLANPCLTPVEIGASRALGGAIALGAIFLAVRRRFTFHISDFIPLSVVVFLGFTWPHALQPWLVTRIGGALVGMAVGFTPLMTLIVAIPMLGHWPTKRQAIGVVGALVFLIVLLRDGISRDIPLRELGMAMGIPVSYAVANCTIQKRLKHLPALELTLLCLMMNSCILWPLSLVLGRPPIDPSGPWTTALVAVTVLGVVGTGIATFLFNKLVQDQGSLFATMTINLTPMGAFLWGWGMGETVTPVQMIALLGVLTMVIVVQFGAASSLNASARADAAIDEELVP